MHEIIAKPDKCEDEVLLQKDMCEDVKGKKMFYR